MIWASGWISGRPGRCVNEDASIFDDKVHERVEMVSNGRIHGEFIAKNLRRSRGLNTTRACLVRLARMW